MSRLDQYFFEIHSGIPREGPGSDESTLQALGFIPNLPTHPAIADMGCGPGKVTLLLAKKTGGKVTGIDIHQPYLDQLVLDAHAKNLTDQIQAVNAKMEEPQFKKEEFDLIWAEGAIYLIGLEKGFKAWHPFLKKGGFVAVTHLSWLTDSPSTAASAFWQEAYPEIDTVTNNIRILEVSGYKLVHHFALPASDWWNEYYQPLEKSISALLEKYPDIADAKAAADQSQSEIDLWKNHSADYGYVFYIGQKI